jgi:hypothetical protein
LFYDQSLSSNTGAGNHLPAEGELSFDSMSESNFSGVTSTNTFRDTQVDQEQSYQLMHVQSLASISNNPKKNTMFKRLKNLYA